MAELIAGLGINLTLNTGMDELKVSTDGVLAVTGPFVTALPLTSRLVMAPTTISAPVAFTVGMTPGLMVETYVKLTADGTNTPTFAGMTEWGGSLGWDNTAGMVNNIAFFHDGTTTYYSVTQDLGATPVPTAPGIPVLSLGTEGSTSVGLTWTLPTGGTPTDYIVEFRLVAGTWATFTDGVSTSRAATVTGLAETTAYEFRVSATNAVGTSGTSNVVTGTTTSAVVESFVRLNQLSGSNTESGDGTTGWLYSDGAYGDWTSWGQSTTNNFAGDGTIRTLAKSNMMLGVSNSNVLTEMTGKYTPYFDNTGNLLMVRMGDGIAVACNVVAGLNRVTDSIAQVRVTIAGAVLSSHVSTDGVAWTKVDEYTDPAGAIARYPWISIGQGITTSPLIATGAA